MYKMYSHIGKKLGGGLHNVKAFKEAEAQL